MTIWHVMVVSSMLTAAAMASKKPAAQPQEVEITGEPHHQMILQNEYVRVFEVKITPKDSTILHDHRKDYFYVMLGPAEISNEVTGKAPVKTTFAEGDVKFVESGFSHIVRDVGATPFHNITVELMKDKPAEKAAGDDAAPAPSSTENLIFEKDGVRVFRVQLETAGFQHPHHHDGPHLLIALTDLTLRSEAADKTAATIELKAGQIRWFEGNLPHAVTNVGTQPAKFVALEF